MARIINVDRIQIQIINKDTLSQIKINNILRINPINIISQVLNKINKVIRIPMTRYLKNLFPVKIPMKIHIIIRIIIISRDKAKIKI